MSLRLSSVEDYIDDARTLLLDRIVPYRYDDISLLVAFNTALLEGRRLRPDLFVFKHGSGVPSYDAVSGEEVPIEPQFRLAFVYGTVAHALARDTEDVQDTRATSFMNIFQSILTGVKQAPLQGGTPSGGNQQGSGGLPPQ